MGGGRRADGAGLAVAAGTRDSNADAGEGTGKGPARRTLLPEAESAGEVPLRSGVEPTRSSGRTNEAASARAADELVTFGLIRRTSAADNPLMAPIAGTSH